LTPHPFEFQALREARVRIAEFAEKADVVTISHYHFDHHTPSYEDWLSHWTDAETARQIYQDKLVLAKNYRSSINPSQRRRGWIFRKTGGRYARKLLFADSCDFSFGETRMRFSRPVPHGLPDTPLGWVLMAIIEYEDEKVLHASDVQGPMDKATLQVILAEEPQLLIVGGPPLYLADFKVTDQQIQQGLRNLETLARTIPVTIVEHHLLRDLEWRQSIQEIFKSARKSGNKLASAAEFLGKEDKLLEAKRKPLFEETPPGPDYKKWTKLPEQKRRRTKPPF
jgi:predicted metallo-beta-lactamase superfamily hydrolase